MMERHHSLRSGARLIGVDRETLKDWLRRAGILLPPVRRGSRLMIAESDILKVVAERRDLKYYPRPEQHPRKKRDAAA